MDAASRLVGAAETYTLFAGAAFRLDEVEPLELPAAEAIEILEAEFFEAPGFDELPTDLQEPMFLFAVEHSAERAVIALHVAINRLGHALNITGELTSASFDALMTLDTLQVIDALSEREKLLAARIAELLEQESADAPAS